MQRLLWFLYGIIAVALGVALSFPEDWTLEDNPILRAAPSAPPAARQGAPSAEHPDPGAERPDPSADHPASSVSEAYVTYYEDQTLQATAEYILANHRMSVHDMKERAATYVLIGVREGAYCSEPQDGSGVYVEGVECAPREIVSKSPVPLHPYYDYPVESLVSLALGDGIAAAVLAERLMPDDPEVALHFAMISAELTGKIGPLIVYVGDLASIGFDEELAKGRIPRLRNALRDGSPTIITRYAIDALIAESELPKQMWFPLDRSELDEFPEVKTRVNEETAKLRERLTYTKNLVGEL